MTTSEEGPPPNSFSDGKNSGPASSDGRGGTDPSPGPIPGPRYIYYRLYTQDGALKSNIPIYSNNHFISRVMSKSVAPPRTASSLKKLLCKVEGFEGPESCALYLSVSEKSSLEATARLSFRGDSGPGSSVLDPMALVVGSQASEKRSAAVGEAKMLVERLDEQAIRYVYYRVYDESGEVVSKTSFNEDDTSLGRMETFSIPPPHTVASLKSCINKAEGMSGHDLQVFEDEEGEVTMEEDNTIALLTDTYPGIVEGEPIVIVYESQKKTSVSDLQTFAKRIKSTYSSTWVSDDPNWHSLEPGVIFRTDGILIKKLYKKTGVESEGYMAIDSEGKRACISKSWARFC